MATGANEMDEEQKKRSEPYTGNFGEKEFLRFGCTFISLLLLGLAAGMLFHNIGITVIFIVLLWGIMWFAPYWQPAYAIVHKVMGNKDIPPTLPKHHWKWWHYIPIVVKAAILLAALKFGLQLLFS